MFRAYLKAVFLEGWPKVTCSIFDIIGVAIFFLPELGVWFEQQPCLARAIGIGIIFFSFALANSLAYKELAEQLSYKADVYLEHVESSFSPSKTQENPFRVGRRGNPNGFNRQGVPDWGRLCATVRINNRGDEDGRLRWELNKTKVKLPPSLFDIGSTKDIGFGGMGDSAVIKGGSFPFVQPLTVAVLFTEKDPHTFARKLKELIESKACYEINIRYWTERPDGVLTNPRDLPIRGDFQSFYQEILKYWDGYGHGELAGLARFVDTENA